MSNWTPFPHDPTPFDYADDALRDVWPDLHRGDRVTFPDEGHLANVLEQCPEAAPKDFDGDVPALAAMIRSAWRAFHAGRFQEAVDTAARCGHLAHAPANKAAGVYGNYLEADSKRQVRCFEEAAARAEAAIAVLPDDANAHYFNAFNLGRYSQTVSVVDALRQGVGGRIQSSLTRALELEPGHAEAHTAFGMYHAEIIDKVGRMIGSMTYGASIDKAIEHFETAIALTPESPIAYIEYGNGLYLMFGDKRLDEVTDLYVKAAAMNPRDAMEKLDVECALAELE